MILFILGLLVGAFIGASLMWWAQEREARKLPEWLHQANESAAEWLRRDRS